MKIPKYFVTIGIVAVLISFCPAQMRGDIVFNTLGPGDTYNQSAGTFVGFQTQSGGPFFEIAAQFTAQTSGNLATVDLGLTFVSGTTPGSVSAFLYGDAAGSPDNADQTLLGSGTPTGAFTTTNNSLLSLTVSGVPVTMGSVYWLVVKPVNPLSQHTIWNASSPAVTGLKQFTTNDSTWQPASNNVLPAFRLETGLAPVPDSGDTLLIMLGSVAALLVVQGVLRNERSS